MMSKSFLISNAVSLAAHGALIVGVAGAAARFAVPVAPTAIEVSIAGNAENGAIAGVSADKFLLLGKVCRNPKPAGGHELDRPSVRMASHIRQMDGLKQHGRYSPPVSNRDLSGPFRNLSADTPAIAPLLAIPGNSDVTSVHIGTTSPTHGACPEINPPPIYPRAARKAGIEGKVTVLVRINPGGTVDGVNVFTSSGHSMLDEAAVNAVRNWKFIPARNLGIPVSSEMKIPIVFQLKD